MDSTRTRWREEADRPFLDELPPRQRAEQFYDSMPDAQLVAFVGERLLKLHWWIQRRPRSIFCRPAIIDELQRNPPV